MKKVILCGLGAVGLTFAVKLKENADLRILVDEGRLKKYTSSKPVLNGIEQNFKYILPADNFDADLIIISTKSNSLDEVIHNIKNFVTPKTKIISLINGISSEEKIQKAYSEAQVLKSYFIGHSAVRSKNSVTQDGTAKIVAQKDELLKEIFEQNHIDYEFPEDIDYSMWLKYTLNLFSNQTSAILKMTFGEMKHSKTFIEFAKKVTAEVRMVAEKKGIKNLENLEKDALNALSFMCDDGKTSMLQDILAKRHTESDIFGEEIIRLGKLYNVPTPYNQVLTDLIKIEEELVCEGN